MNKTILRSMITGVALTSVLSFTNITYAEEVDRIHFLIPAGAGGGWDGTARGTGEVLTKSGLIENASFENLSGGGGGKAIGYLIENAASQQDTLMVNSTPIIIRSLTGIFPQSYRDLTPVAATIGDYAAFVVKADSDIQSFSDLVEIYNQSPNELAVAGGSTPGSMDHVVAAMAFKTAGVENAQSVNYLPFDAGSSAMAGLLSGEADVLSTGLSEAIDLANAGEVRILAHTGDQRVDAAADVPTLVEQGVDMTFTNWRGFFGPPGLSEEKKQAYITILESMYATPEWEEIRARYGWIDIFKPDQEFIVFLEDQEKVIGDLMKELGFL